jgi:hypothetical protein
MTELPWTAFTPEELAEMGRRADVADRHDHQVPARDAAERAEYDRIDQERQELAEWEARDIHFHGRHVQDQYIEHQERCEYSCPYDTPEQAAERRELAARAERNEMEPGQ